MHYRSLLCIILMLAVIETRSQEINPYKKSYYVYLGYGWGGQKYANDFGVVIQVSKGSLLALTGHGTHKADTEDYLFAFDTSPIRQTTSAALSTLYGRIWKKPWGHLTLAGGPSFVTATRYHTEGDPLFPTYYIGSDHRTVGFCMEGRVMPSWKFVGLGISAFLNVNDVFTHGGITANLALGRINYKRKTG